MSNTLSLHDALPISQEMQLELIRRTKFNSFDGERVFAALLKHRTLWASVLLDRPGVSPPYGSALLLIDGLIKLRDLPQGIWNADTLYVLTPAGEVARELARHLESENLGGDITVYDDQSEIGPALGVYGESHGLLTIWWD